MQSVYGIYLITFSEVCDAASVGVYFSTQFWMNYMLLLSKKKKASQLTCLVVVSCITNGSCRPTHIGAKLSYGRMAADAIWMPQYSKIQKSAIWGNPSIPSKYQILTFPINYTCLFNQVSINHLPVYKYGIGMYYKNDYNSTMHMGRLRPIVHYKNTFKKSSSPFSLGGWHALWCGLLQHTEYVCKKLIYDILDIFK